MKRNTAAEAITQAHLNAMTTGDLVLNNDFSYLGYICGVLGITFFYEYARDHYLAKDEYSKNKYHNWTHIQNMTLNAYEGFLYSKVEGVELRSGMIAALFHDFDHLRVSGIDDTINIRKAVKGFLLCNQNAEKHALKPEQEQSVVEYIQSTRFPYVGSVLKLSVITRVLRDADMMMIYISDKDVVAAALAGLFNERPYPEMTRNIRFEMNEFLRNQTTFTRKLVWQSAWGKKKSIIVNWIHHSKVAQLYLTKRFEQELN